jgi:endogenous inhibitor of DNA gyrase (YacG/DUF329 family)
MTNSQKTEINRLRNNGKSYSDIADALGLTAGAVKSFCIRNKGGGQQQTVGRPRILCEQCKKPMKETAQAHRRFCSDTCRMEWWHKHPGKLNKKAIYDFTCPACHKKFSAYGNSKRKYCSRKCYGKSKKAVAE